MKRFLESVERTAREYPERLAVALNQKEKTMTYAQLWEDSGKIFNYLSDHGIGKEDFVQIILPRGPMPIAAMMGVMRAGAAFTIVEDIYPAQRVEYIYKDCGCKLRIDYNKYQEIMDTVPAKEGYIVADLHDACYAIYTSGSTGNPKGVLHEYGKIRQCLDGTQVLSILAQSGVGLEEFSATLIVPLSFVVMIMETVLVLDVGGSLYIVSLQVVRNLVKYNELLINEKITVAYMSPSMLRVYNNDSDALKLIMIGSEPANNLFISGPRIVNSYAMSETGFIIACFVLDKAYDKAPVGKNLLGLPIQILDDDGHPVPDGEVGEICIQNEYFREYIHLPELTKKVLRGGIFHTNDLGFKDESGNLILSGRIDDMIKINGNRIEPGEIEVAAQEQFGIKHAIAKGFDENGRAFVVLYYLNSESGSFFASKSAEELSAELAKRLPQYMLPTYYVGLDELPLLPNGKISRKDLKSPVTDMQKTDYVPPTTDLQKRICDEMGRILKTDRIGIKDDFFLCGGDSMGTIALVTACSDLDISSDDIYKCRTPEKLCLYIEKHRTYDMDAANDAMLGQLCPLMPGQKYQLKCLLSMPDSDMMNMPILLKLNPRVNLNRLRKALENGFKAHPVFLTKLVKKDDEYYQCYDENLFSEVPVIDIPEAEFEELRVNGLVKPFVLLDSVLYRCAIYRTEKSVYLFLDTQHIIFDGASYGLLMKDFISFYQNENYVPRKDYYYGIIKRYLDAKGSPEEKEIQEYYKRVYSDSDTLLETLRLDNPTDEKEGAVELIPYEMEKSDKHNNTFFIVAMAMAVAKFNRAHRSMIYWLYNTRTDSYSMRTVGAFAAPMPVYLTFSPDDDTEALLGRTQEQIKVAMAHSNYSWLLDHSDKNIVNMARLNYRNNMDISMRFEGFIDANLPLPSVTSSAGVFSISIRDDAGNEKLKFGRRYSKSNLNRESIDTLSSYFKEAAEQLDQNDKKKMWSWLNNE
ncbi:MAG: non-ribosomal peptide synthetase [Lachnospiraceae bacterium]|nr:non-ribosomal peptide synthetase [Lachnospiraceae bacterium]